MGTTCLMLDQQQHPGDPLTGIKCELLAIIRFLFLGTKSPVRKKQVQLRHYLSEAYHIALEARKWHLIPLRVCSGEK